MSDPPRDKIEGHTDFAPGGSLNELRELLFGPQKAQLQELQERLDDPKFHGKEVSRVLPEAIVLRSKQDRKLTTALMPTVEEIIRTSVRKDPRPLADALFPVIGPAIRKAIAETFRKMIQSLNQTLDHSLSWQGVKWRIEALRTGKSFAEIVLLHSLVYRVEQIFLIHRETGLLLQHVVREAVTVPDAHMVSGMLTAIQDFVRDSFRLQEGDTLGTIQFGELTVWIEQGPRAVLAGVIRGTAPEDLKTDFREALENIHLEQGEALEAFNGDPEPFEAIRYHLEACLTDQYSIDEKKRKFSPALWLLPAALLAGLGFWLFVSIRDHLRWTDYLARLHEQPGIVVTSVEKRSGRHFVAGLRDPLAADPVGLLSETELDPDEVESHWEPYQALEPRFVLARAERLLNPPESVSLRLDGSVLIAEGSARRSWILEARKLAHAIAGVEAFQETNVADLDVAELGELRASVNRHVFLFAAGAADFLPGQDDTVGELASEIARLEDLASTVGTNLRIEIAGHADTSGTETSNRRLSRQRAERMRDILVSRGANPGILTAVGVGSEQPLRDEVTEADRIVNRRVTLRVILTERGTREAQAP